MQVIEVDVHDDVTLRAFHDVQQVCADHDRVHPLTRTYDALAASARVPNPYQRLVLLAAYDEGGGLLGVGELWLPLQDNLHVAEVSVDVLPGVRRRGVGSLLHRELDRRRRAEARTVTRAEVLVPTGAGASPGLAFARSLGYRSAHTEDHLILELTVSARRLEALAEAAAPAERDHDIIGWSERCPDELVEAYCRLRSQMELDVPVGELDVEPVTYDEARLRTGEERTARSYEQLVAAARRRSDGMLVGYSIVFLPRGTAIALQDDTLVMPADRGHRLGTALKLATLRRLQDTHPERTWAHTWTDPGNEAMYRTNTAFGYTPVEVLHEMERRDAPLA